MELRQRYVEHLPTSGEMVFCDRSRSDRAGVERVMGFCTKTEYPDFTHPAPDFEHMQVRSGIRLFKVWFSVTLEEQHRCYTDTADAPWTVIKSKDKKRARHVVP